MPFCSTEASAFVLISSSLMSFAASSSVSALSASATFIFFSLRRAPPSCWNMPWSWLVRSSMPGGAMISICGAQQRDLDFDLLVVELAFAQHLAEFLPRAGVGRLHVVEVDFARRRQQHVEQPLLGGVGGAVAHLARFGFARLLDRGLDQVANDRVDVAADVAHFGELGRLDLDERRVGEPRQPARDFRLAHAGRADHQDVLRRDLLAQRLRHLLAPPAIAQRDRDGALGGVLPDDVLVELGDDFVGGHVRHRSPAAKLRSRAAKRAATFYRVRSRRPLGDLAMRDPLAYHALDTGPVRSPSRTSPVRAELATGLARRSLRRCAARRVARSRRAHSGVRATRSRRRDRRAAAAPIARRRRPRARHVSALRRRARVRRRRTAALQPARTGS